MITSATLTIETGDEYSCGQRWATLRIHGVAVFTALVYDTDGEGRRTHEQAARNMLHVLGGHLRRLENEGQ